jgi:hypothetical protein
MQNAMDDSVRAIIVINPVPPTRSATRDEAPEAVFVADATDADAEREADRDAAELADALWFPDDEPDADATEEKVVIVELPETITMPLFVAVTEPEIMLSVTRFSGRVVTLTETLVPLAPVAVAPVVAALTLSLLMPK